LGVWGLAPIQMLLRAGLVPAFLAGRRGRELRPREYAGRAKRLFFSKKRGTCLGRDAAKKGLGQLFSVIERSDRPRAERLCQLNIPLT